MGENEIVGRMNAFLEKCGGNKAQMARKLGMDAGTLGNILRGNRGLNLSLVLQFLSVYDVSAEWLIRGNGAPTQTNIEGSIGNVVGSVGGDNVNNGSDVIACLSAQLAEKDKQINQLLQILAAK